MRTQASWEELQENLEAARLLAVFLNLEPSEFSKFKKEHWDFVPLLASMTLASMKQFQTQLQNVWKNGFCQKEVLEALSSNDVMGGGRVTTTVEDDQGGLRTKTQTLTEYQHGLTYKKAILFLFTNSWRAKTCKWSGCRKRFIGEHSQARFCSFGAVVDGNPTTCFWAHRKPSQQESWNENRARINVRRRREYRLEKKRRRHAKRKNLRKG